MGFWKITIDGHGIHDNQRADDADALLSQFVDLLRSQGHDVLRTEFLVHGGSVRVVEGETTSEPAGP